jgi:hypothetical protein
MWQSLVEQLEKIRSIISDEAGNVHKSVGDQLNEIYSYIRSIDNIDIVNQMNHVSPLRYRDEDSYIINKQAALIFCDRLIGILSPKKAVPEPEYKTELKRLIPLTDKVFIIHGHDHINMMRLKSMLKDRFHLNPIILSEMPDQGRALIEKFEDEASHTAYAFAIITPDDEIVHKEGTSRQARPNVTFEIGWFYGRLGRNRVCLLMKKGSMLHSDLAGIMRIEFIESVDEKLGEIEIELNSSELFRA